MVREITGRLLDEKAFTLIEMIVSLVLISIFATAAGLGIAKISQGYIFAKQDTETQQKAQVAMARMVKELGWAAPQTSTATAITAATASSVTYTRPQSIGSSTFVTNTLTISGSSVLLSGNASGTLVNNVVSGSSSFAYYDTNGATLATPVALSRIRRIDITLSLTGADNLTSQFTNSVWINESY
ncbi:MAG TPA: type II secretion system protein [Smithella sp.]|nr:type II secretion system protein [Smithella sp.]